MKKPIRVLVADSNQTQSQLLTAALRRQASFLVSACASEVRECLQVVGSSAFDVVLVGEGRGDGEETLGFLRALHRRFPQLAIIFMMDFGDRNLVVNSLRAGVRGFFSRATQPFKALCKCIYAVHGGQIWANTQQIEYVVEALTQSPIINVTSSTGDVLLTRRESQVVSLVAEGLTNRKIAEQLGITENTAKKSLLRIFEKLGISNRVELVLYAITSREVDASTKAAGLCAYPAKPAIAKLDCAIGRDRLISPNIDASTTLVDIAS